MDYNIAEYREWLAQNVTLTNAFTPDALRRMTHHILMGRNYRLITEYNTKSKLLYTYLWISDVVKKAQAEYGEDWKLALFTDLYAKKRRSPEEKNFLNWFIGLTTKTATNLGMLQADYPQAMTDLLEHIHRLFSEIGRDDEVNNAWVLMMAGSASLSLRGSDKSKAGKQFERIVNHAMLTMLGLEEGKHFKLNLERDEVVGRETDAEVYAKRVTIRIEVGLIAPGNQEVIEDKVDRVGEHGVVIFDRLGDKSRVKDSADKKRVQLIQIRNSQPLVALYRYLAPLMESELIKPPELDEELMAGVNALPDEIFNWQEKKKEKKPSRSSFRQKRH